MLACRHHGQGRDDRGQHLVGERADVLAWRQPARLGGTDIATQRFGVETDPDRDSLLAGSGQPLQDHFLQLDHRNLAERHRRLLDPATSAGLGNAVIEPSREGGMLLRILQSQGGMLLRKSPKRVHTSWESTVKSDVRAAT